MDPISFTASLLAISGLAVTIVQRIDQLRRSLNDAQGDLCQLVNEISDMQVVLGAINSSSTGQETELEYFHGLLTRAKNNLAELDVVVQRCVRDGCRNEGNPKLLKLRWLKEKNRVRRIQSDLRETRQNLVLALGTYNYSGISRLHVKINQLSCDTAQGQTRGTDFSNAVIEHLSRQVAQFRDIHESNLQLQTMVESIRLSLEATQEEKGRGETVTATETGTHLRSAQAILRARPQEQSINILQVEASYAKKYCRHWCSCVCHAKQNIRSPTSWKRLFGSLFIGYSGVPVIAQECNEFHCKQRSSFRVTVNYQFPEWFWTRAIFISLLSTSIGGPELILRIPRKISWRSDPYQNAVIGNTEILRKLLDAGKTSVYDVDPDGVSLINNAIRYSHFSTCELLISYGANVYREDPSGLSPFDNAWNKILSEPADSHEKRRLIELFPQNNEMLDDRQFTRLHKIVLRLIQREIDVELEESTALLNTKDGFGRTALWWAARRSDIDAVRVLLDYGADFRMADGEGQQPLHAAAWACSPECLALLLKRGADVNCRDTYGVTPLKIVASCVNDDMQCLELLINSGANINVRCDAGVTPVSIATSNVMLKTAQYLIDGGADINIRDCDGWDCLQINIYWNEHESIKLCLKYGPNYLNITMEGYTLLHIVAMHGDTQTIEILRASPLIGLDIEAKDRLQRTAKELADMRENMQPEWKVAFERLLHTIETQNHVVEEEESNEVDDNSSDSEFFEDALEFHNLVQ